jgi:hypothetical protein
MKAGKSALRGLIGIISILAIGRAAIAAAPSASELLAKYSKALDATKSYVDSYEATTEFSYNSPTHPTPMKDGKGSERGQHRTDGRRTYIQSYSWGDITPEDRDRPESRAMYHLRIEVGRKCYDTTGVANAGSSAQWFTLPAIQADKTVFRFCGYSGISGSLGSLDRLDTMLRRAARVTLRQTTETINGSACYVLDADTAYGKYAIWLDPDHGYQPARLTRTAKGGDKDYEFTLEKGVSRKQRVEVARFEKIDGVWVPMEGDQEHNYKFADARYFTNEKVHFKRIKITLSPDHDKLGSFVDPLEKPSQDPELKNGTKVWLPPDHERYKWQDGKIVPDEETRKKYKT